MSYSNGKLPEDTFSHEKVIEIVKGLPGVGFKLTDNGDYDMQNKKLRNAGSPQTNDDATTKSYVDSEVNKTLKLDGSSSMLGALNMDNRRIENVAPARHGFSDAVSSLHLHTFFFDLNTNDGKIEAQNPIDMKNEKISNLAEGTDNSDAITKHQLETGLAPKADKTELSNYLKRDGTVSVTGNFDFGDNIITKVGNGSQSTDVVNKGYIDTELAAKPNINQVVLRDGSQDMTGNLDMNNKKIVNLADPIGANDVTNKAYVDSEVRKTLKLDGSSVMTSVLDMNNQRIINLGNATHNQDAITLKQVNDGIATVSTENNQYTDQQIAKSHISTHTNRKNVLSYAMDDGEFTEDFGIQDVTLIDFDDMPHKTNKKAFSMKVRRTTDGSNEYKGRFDFNLFKMYRDNKSDKYTVCIETYFQKSPFYDYEFVSTLLGFEKLNINIDLGTTIKVNSEYKYLRTILNLSPDGTSPSIQRRLYVNFKSNFDSDSPNLLPVYVLIYGIKGEAKNDLDMTIYDYEKAYEVANNQFQLHFPIDMNNNKITGLALATNDSDAISKKFFIDSILQLNFPFRTAVLQPPINTWVVKNSNNQDFKFSSIFIKTVVPRQAGSYSAGRFRLGVTHGTPSTTIYFPFAVGLTTEKVVINRRFSNVTSILIKTAPTFYTTTRLGYTGNIFYAP